MLATVTIHGTVVPGFEDVRDAFRCAFRRPGQAGAALAVYWRGEKVVDLWGGPRVYGSMFPWTADTMVVLASGTVGLTAMTLAVAHARGWLDYEAPVARYWPEFARHDKGEITVRQLLAHEAGLVSLDESLPISRMHDLDHAARVLARQRPAWAPGTRHGYHAITLGLAAQELVGRIDPEHRSLGRVFWDEIADPLDLDLFIGLPATISEASLAKVWPRTMAGALRKVTTPGSPLDRAYDVVAGLDWNDRRNLEVELPGNNGVGTARAVARAYAAFADGGAELGIGTRTFARIVDPPSIDARRDEVLAVPTRFSLGFLRPGPAHTFGSSARAFGSPDVGGSFAFADPDAELGYAFVTNALDFRIPGPPRDQEARAAVARAIARCG